MAADVGVCSGCGGEKESAAHEISGRKKYAYARGVLLNSLRNQQVMPYLCMPLPIRPRKLVSWLRLLGKLAEIQWPRALSAFKGAGFK